MDYARAATFHGESDDPQMLAQDSFAEFFELSDDLYGGAISFLISLVAWAVIYLGLSEGIDTKEQGSSRNKEEEKPNKKQ